MSANIGSGRKLQILSTDYVEPQQLDLLSFVSGHGLPEFVNKTKQVRGAPPKTKQGHYHFHGNVDGNKSFANFYIGKSNQFAVQAVKRFISIEKSDFGVIFLMAKSGLGKSHVLHAVANEMLSVKKSFYFSSPLMMSPIIDTLGLLKSYDILLIDDIEEIEGNYELQKVVCQLIDYAQAGKIKLIITGAKSPKDLVGCDERMKGKLSGALVHHMDKINFELAFEIVGAKSSAMNLDLPDKVKRLVADELDFNLYGMESLLYKLKNSVEIQGQQITFDMVLEEVKVKSDKKSTFRSNEAKELMESVAQSFGVSYQELISSIRKHEFALARHVAMYILKQKKHLSVIKIAEIFGRDHSSVVYAISRIQKLMNKDFEIRSKIQVLMHCD